MHVISYGINRLYLGMHIIYNTYMHVIMITEKRDNEFEGDQGGKVWREQWEENTVISKKV